jgi:F-type H+-transporting ATPase subunit b
MNRSWASLRVSISLLAFAVLTWPATVFGAPVEHAGTPDAVELPHGEAHGGGIEWVTPVFGGSGKLGLLWILINFAVLMWLLEKLLFSKLRASTRRKHEDAKSELSRATTAREKAEATLAEYETRLKKLETEISGLLAEAKTRAEADRARIVEAARAEAAQIEVAARAAAEREADAVRRKLEAEVVDRAVERAEAIIRQQIGPSDQRTMVDDFITRLGGVQLSGHTGPASSASGGAKGGPTA